MKKGKKFATKLAHQLFISVIVIIISFLTGFSLLIAGSFMFISESENSYNNVIIEQINNNTESLLVSSKNVIRELAYSKDLHDYLVPPVSSDNIARKESLKSFEREVTLLLAYTGEMCAIIVQSSQSAQITLSNSDFDNRAFTTNVITDPSIKGAYFLAPYYDNNIYKHLLPVIMPIYSDYNDVGEQENLGNCFILLDFSFFYINVDNLKKDAFIDLFLIGKEGEVLIGDVDRFDSIINYSNENGNKRFGYNSRRYEIAARNVDVSDYNTDTVFSIMAVLRKSALSENIIYLFIISLASMIPSMVVIILSFRRAKRDIGYSIGEIRDFTQQINDVNLNYRMSYAEDSDYRGIYENINDLLDKFMVINENLMESEMLKTQAELKMLKSQINPHFIYNTLECIRGISMDYGAEEISDIAYSMAQILRYSISGGNFSTIKEELNIVQEYLTIMTMRSKNNITFRIEVEDSILELPVLKMALQLMVENSFKHGNMHKVMDEIVISGKREDDFVIFEISDNGSGIDIARLELLRHQIERCNEEESGDVQGIGLVNIQKRLLLLCGAGSGVSVSGSLSEGFKVILRYKLKE